MRIEKPGSSEWSIDGDVGELMRGHGLIVEESTSLSKLTYKSNR
jgi:hypothetical protein